MTDGVGLHSRALSERYVLDDQIGFVLRLAVQFHTSIFTSRMVEGLTQTQFATLAKIHEIGACSQSELGRLIMLDSATVNGVVDRMRQRGLIAIADDPNDGRRQSLTLTRKGDRVVEQAESVACEITAQTLQLLTGTEQARLVQLLRKMMGIDAADMKLRQPAVRRMPRLRSSSAVGKPAPRRRAKSKEGRPSNRSG